MQSFAKKIGMTHYYDNQGMQKVATVLELAKTVCAGERTQEKDGYNAKIYALISKNKATKKSLAGQFKDIENIKKVCEQKNLEDDNTKINEQISIDKFSEGDLVSILGKGKGKGFAGTIKRHSFNTGPKTHGSNNYRQPGSIGDTGPARVVAGKKMAGHMGSGRVRIKDIVVVKVEKEKNWIWLNSPIPGANKSVILIEKK